MRYTKIPPNTFKEIQLNAGVVLTNFDPETGEFELETDILGATSGGVNFKAAPSFEDYGSDIDNCPKNMLQLKVLTEWEVTMSGEFTTVTPQTLAYMVGAGDEVEGKITPRNDVLTTDFKELWWVGDYGEDNSEESGQFIAIRLFNALSTGGFEIQSSDKEKGKFAFEFTGHYSMDAQDTVPFEIYFGGGEGGGE